MSLSFIIIVENRIEAMLPTLAEHLMDDAQAEKYQEVIDYLEALEKTSDPNDPWMFHGTSQSNAAEIVKQGFEPTTSYVYVPGDGENGTSGKMESCVYWTPLVGMAKKFAEKRSSMERGFPMIFVAKMSDLLMSGQPVADYNTWSIDFDSDPNMKPKDWKQSLVTMGAIAIVDCRSVPNVELFGPATVDIWPSRTTYDSNLQAYFREIQSSRASETPAFSL